MYFKHEIKTKIIDEIIKKSQKWDWFVEYLEENVSFNTDIKSLDDFNYYFRDAIDTFQYLSKIYEVYDESFVFRKNELIMLNEIVLFYIGQKNLEQLHLKGDFEKTLAMLVYAGKIYNQSNNKNYLFFRDIFTVKNIFQKDDICGSILKSQAIFKTFQLIEKANELYRYSDSISILTSYPHIFYINNRKCEWDGKWLFSESQEFVSAKSISKHNLNKSIYGKVLLDSSLYEKLKFKKDKVDKLEDVIKKLDNSDLSEADIDLVFESVLQQKYGMSLNEFENTLPTSLSSNNEECFEFPSSKVKNWEALKKHVAEMMYFASPVEYEYVVRRIRTSSPDASIKAYLMNMYRIHNTYEYACQMCHSNCESIEKCQIEINPKNELAPMNICVCPNCATKFRAYRNDEYRYNKFMSAIKKLTRIDIESSDPVVIAIGSHKVWFSQTHIAEICELLKLKDPTTANIADEEDDYVEAKTNSNSVVSSYVGKKVYLKRQKEMGNIIECKVNGNETLITIKFIDGNRIGEEKEYSLDMCIKNKLIEFLDT